ncbi:MAG: GH3 auxin-responsive promoter family protein, partial [Crocinitomicaceae bacterium]|nr:GH3 auxin-responsive promoter family protein [Crocinitomicaceae bacterium]
VWPNLELFMHGGVSFEPYKQEFQRLIPDKTMNYVETYNASEGFFGIQDQLHSDELLLMLDYGIYYEFIPMSSFDGIHSKEVCNLEEVELYKNYALVISSNGGLWRYIIGDTIQFTNLKPFRFKITGRTKQFINTFGEEIIVDNAEKAIAYACEQTKSQLKEFTACPIYMEVDQKGGHEWFIEFTKEPENTHEFTTFLDNKLGEINSDYAAKRASDLVLQKPVVRILPEGTFNKWLKSIEKLGGQNKVPRLSNNRKIVEEILAILA